MVSLIRKFVRRYLFGWVYKSVMECAIISTLSMSSDCTSFVDACTLLTHTGPERNRLISHTGAYQQRRSLFVPLNISNANASPAANKYTHVRSPREIQFREAAGYYGGLYSSSLSGTLQPCVRFVARYPVSLPTPPNAHES